MSSHGYLYPQDLCFPRTANTRGIVTDADLINNKTRVFLDFLGGPQAASFREDDNTGLYLNLQLDRGIESISGQSVTRFTWHGDPGAWSVIGNKAQTTVSGAHTADIGYHYPDYDPDASVDLSATGEGGLYFRNNPGFSALGQINVGLKISSGKIVATDTGSGGGVLFTGTTTITSGTTYTLRVATSGSTYTVYLNGSVEGTFTSTKNVSGGAFWLVHGIYTQDTGSRFANWTMNGPSSITATTYTLRNYDGVVVATGSISGASYLEFDDSILTQRNSRGPYGSYRLYLTGPDRGDGQFGTAYGDCAFVRIPNSSLPGRFSFHGSPSIDGENDPLAEGVMGMGTGRYEVALGVSTAPTITAITALLALSKSKVINAASSVRPRTSLVSFGAGTHWVLTDLKIDATTNTKVFTASYSFTSIDVGLTVNITGGTGFTPGTYTVASCSGGVATLNSAAGTVGSTGGACNFNYDSQLTTVVAGIVAAGYPGLAYETFNEPNPTASYVTNNLTPFYNAVKAGDPTATVLAPAIVAFNQGSISEFQSLLDNGGAAVCDAFSFHPYNTYDGDLANMRVNLSAVLAKMAAAGVGSRDIWMTEQGFPWQYAGVIWPHYATRWNADMYFFQSVVTHDQMRPETTAYWYDLQHGFAAFPTYFVGADGCGPTQLPTRTMSAELYGKTFTSELNFGTYGKNLYGGATWTNPTTHDAVVGVCAASFGANSIRFAVTGASLFTVVDPWGNTFTLTATNGIITLPAHELPQWIRVPSGTTCTLVANDWNWGTNVALGENATTTITVPSFGSGEWTRVPVSVKAGDLVQITATITNAGTLGDGADRQGVISGLFFGGPTTTPAYSGQSQSPQGTWVSNYGADGAIYAYNGATVSTFSNATLSFDANGFNHSLAAEYNITGSEDKRALENAAGTKRNPSEWFGYNNPLILSLTFTQDYTGSLAIYMLDWSNLGMQQTVQIVANNITPGTPRARTSNSNPGSGAPTSLGGGAHNLYFNLYNLNNDTHENSFMSSAEAYVETSQSFPQWAGVLFNAQTVNRLVVFCEPPWHALGTLTDFDLQTYDGSSWTTRQTWTSDLTKSFAFVSGIARCVEETFWDDQWVFDCELPSAVSVQGVRCYIRGTSFGAFDTKTTNDAANNGQGGFGTWVYIREMQAFSTVSGAAPILLNAAGHLLRSSAGASLLR